MSTINGCEINNDFQRLRGIVIITEKECGYTSGTDKFKEECNALMNIRTFIANVTHNGSFDNDETNDLIKKHHGVISYLDQNAFSVYFPFSKEEKFDIEISVYMRNDDDFFSCLCTIKKLCLRREHSTSDELFNEIKVKRSLNLAKNIACKRLTAIINDYGTVGTYDTFTKALLTSR